jgi:CheY-like chemotaxis protein
MDTATRLTALVVDDDPISLEVTRRRLEELDFDVTVREHSLGTSRWILENQPDLVLLDVVMPALTGAELAAVLQRSSLRVNVVLYSSKSQHELDRLARSAGVLGGISKERTDLEFKKAILGFVQAAKDASSPESRRSL